MNQRQLNTVNGQQLANIILGSIKPWYYQDDIGATAMRQGNWPCNAEFAVTVESYDRGMYNNKSAYIKYFASEEQMEEYLKNYNGDVLYGEIHNTINVYGWDWGPFHMRRFDCVS